MQQRAWDQPSGTRLAAFHGDETPPSGNSTLHWIKPFIIDADVSLAIGILTNISCTARLGHSVFGSMLDGRRRRRRARAGMR